MSEMINPYIAGAPVTERTMFFGRQDVFEWVQRSLTGKFVDHILVIHGQRRVGKTSVLKQIPFHLPPTYIPVFFDLQGRTHTTIDRFLWRLAKEITRTLRTSQDISLPEPSREEFSRDSEFFQNQFLPQLSEAIGDRRLLLIFDEFDSLEEPTAREMLTKDLIPYLSRLMHAPGPLAFIFSIGSSGRKLEHMQASYTDFFRIALYRKISFLEKEQAFRLITQPVAGVIEYDPRAVENIFHITSGHPYFTQLLCHELFGYCQQSGKRRIGPKDIDAVLDDVVERGTVNLKFVWDDATDPERYVLTALSLSEDGRNAKAIHQFLQDEKVRITQREVTDSLRHLQEKDVLASDSSFTVDLMRLWLLENKPLGRVIEELLEVSPIATRFIEIAQEFHETGMPDEALNNYRRALQVDPQNLIAQVGIASLIFEQGDLPQATEEYQKALEVDPEDVAARSGFCQTHLALGDQLREEGQIEEALQHYRQVLSVNEQHLEARERLAVHHAQEAAQHRAVERFDKAIEAFERALEFIPDDPAISDQLAETQAARRAKGLATLRETGEDHFTAERWDQAIASFQEYLSLEPEDEETVRAVEARLDEAQEQGELAEIYRQAQAVLSQKRYGQAASLFKEIIDRDLSYKDASRLLTQAVELQRRARPLWKDIRVLGGAGGVVVVIAAILLFRFLPGFGEAPTPATATPAPMPAETPAPIPPATEAPRPLTPTPPALTPLLTQLPATPTPTLAPISPIRTLEGHSDSVESVAFSPDGQMLASGAKDWMVILWNVESGEQARTLEARSENVLSVAFSPDGQTLASGARQVFLWRVSDGTLLRTLEGHTGHLRSVAFSRDGATLASGSDDQTVIVWDVESGQQLRTLEGHTDVVPSVALSSDGQTLASGSDDATVILWDVESGQQLRTLTGHTREVHSVAFSPDGQTLASGSGEVILWDVDSGQQLRALEEHDGAVSVAFSPDGTTLASGAEDGTLPLWDVQSGRQLHTLEEGHGSKVRSVAFSPDGQILASGLADGTVILWDVGAVTGTQAPTPQTATPTSTQLPPTRTPRSPTPTFTPTPRARTLLGHTARIETAAFSPDGQILASGSYDNMVRLWSVSDGSLLHTLQGHTQPVWSVAFSPDGQTLASGQNHPELSQGASVILWDVESGERLRTLEHRYVVNSVAFSPDGQTLASAWDGAEVSLWRVADGSLLRALEKHPGNLASVAFSPDGQGLASGGEDGAVRLWRVSDGALLHRLEGHHDEVEIVVFSRDGQTLASGSKDKTAILWDVGSGRQLHTLREHPDPVHCVAFSADGATLATGSWDGSMILWDVQSGHRLHTEEQDMPLKTLAFSPDGDILAASGSDDGTVTVWEVQR